MAFRVIARIAVQLPLTRLSSWVRDGGDAETEDQLVARSQDSEKADKSPMSLAGRWSTVQFKWRRENKGWRVDQSEVAIVQSEKR